MVELVTNVPTLEALSKCSVEPYDAIYLGNPYCWKYDGNLMSNFNDLEIAVEMLKEMGKKVYVTTFAAPRNADLPKIFKLLEKALELGIDAVESTNYGVINYIKKEYDFRIHAGGFTNIYTSSTLELLESLGVERIMPAYELPIEDIAKFNEYDVEIEVIIHGKIPLGISHNCFLLEFEKDVGIGCPHLCKQEIYYRADDLVLKPFGNATLSGKDLCMYEHIEKLNELNLHAYRVESVSERVGYRETVGKIYRKRLKGEFIGEDFEKLKSLAKYGLCNGFYFNKAGQIYVGGLNG